MSKIIWIDLETPDLNPESGVIELAALYEDDSGDKSKAVFHEFCKPDIKPATWDEPLKNRKDNKTISDLTGITWEKLEKVGLSEAALHAKFKTFLGKRIDSYNKQDKAIFAAYNAKFDNEFVRALFLRNNDKYFGSYFYSCILDILSTVAMSFRFGIIPPLENYQQDTVCDYFGIKFNAHSAIEDIKAGRNLELLLEEKIKAWKDFKESQVSCNNCTNYNGK